MRAILFFLFTPAAAAVYAQPPTAFEFHLTHQAALGDTLRYDLGGPVFDMVISSDTTLYWKSLNPRYGTEGQAKIRLLPIDTHKISVAYTQQGNMGVSWYMDFKQGSAKAAFFAGGKLTTFSGTITPRGQRLLTGMVTNVNNEVLPGVHIYYQQTPKNGPVFYPSTRTDAEGRYAIAVPPDCQEISIRFEGAVPLGESDVLNLMITYPYDQPPDKARPSSRRDTITVTGRVADTSDRPLLATIQMEGGGTGVRTDKNGRFSMLVPPGQDVLTITCANYKTRDIILGDMPSVYVPLKLLPQRR